MDKTEKQVKSKQRVADHGEVFTAEREVKAMCDLVADECNRIDSRFLEPACGNGNFLAEVLTRKLASVCKKYGDKLKRPDFELWSVIAVMSIYGVELLEDNAAECRERLFNIWNEIYTNQMKTDANDRCRECVSYVLLKNILCGDALTLKQNNGKPIVFAEWSFVSGTLVKRRDYTLSAMIEGEKKQGSIFGVNADGNLEAAKWHYDPVLKMRVPDPICEYEPIDYWRISENG